MSRISSKRRKEASRLARKEASAKTWRRQTIGTNRQQGVDWVAEKVHFRDTKEEPKERKPILPTINLPFSLRLPPLAQSVCQLVTQLGIYQLSTSPYLIQTLRRDSVQPHAYS
jgi:hypothetical protein